MNNKNKFLRIGPPNRHVLKQTIEVTSQRSLALNQKEIHPRLAMLLIQFASITKNKTSKYKFQKNYLS